MNAIFAVAATLATAATASAVPSVFNGIDPGVTDTDPRPNADAAQAAFAADAAAIGPVTTIDWENLAVTNSTILNPLPGVEVSLSGVDPMDNTVDTAAGLPDDPVNIVGFNTTSGGSKFLRVVPNFTDSVHTASFVFDTPVSAWGAYFTGLGTAAGDLAINFTNGNTETFTLVGDPGGGAIFFGVSEPGRQIATVDIVLTRIAGSPRDIFSIDDVQFAVPAPGAVGLLGVAGIAASRRRR